MEIRIERVTNGFIVRAGCMTFVFDDPVKLGNELARWAHNPDEVEREYSKKFSRQPEMAGAGSDAEAVDTMAQAEIGRASSRHPNLKY